MISPNNRNTAVAEAELLPREKTIKNDQGIEHRKIGFRVPRDIADESDLRLGIMFHQHHQAQPEFLNLLDRPPCDHHFGVALESLFDQQPMIDASNRLPAELRHVRLLMQPRVHWEPVRVMLVIHRPWQTCPFGDPADTHVAHSLPAAEYSFVMSSAASREPFAQTSVHPATVGRLTRAPAHGRPDCLLQRRSRWRALHSSSEPPSSFSSRFFQATIGAWAIWTFRSTHTILRAWTVTDHPLQ
jgi:hypothetical protein